MVAPLDDLPDAGHAGGFQQLAQLGELLLAAFGHDGDQIGALAGATLRPLAVQRWGRSPAIRLAVLHKFDGSSGPFNLSFLPGGAFAVGRRSVKPPS